MINIQKVSRISAVDQDSINTLYKLQYFTFASEGNLSVARFLQNLCLRESPKQVFKYVGQCQSTVNQKNRASSHETIDLQAAIVRQQNHQEHDSFLFSTQKHKGPTEEHSMERQWQKEVLNREIGSRRCPLLPPSFFSYSEA